MLAATRQPQARGPIAAGRPAEMALGRTLRAARKPAGRGVATGTASGGFTGDGAPQPPPEALTQQQEQEVSSQGASESSGMLGSAPPRRPAAHSPATACCLPSDTRHRL